MCSKSKTNTLLTHFTQINIHEGVRHLVCNIIIYILYVVEKYFSLQSDAIKL